MEQSSSDATESNQVSLGYDIIYYLLAECVNEPGTILNFCRASKRCYELYIRILYRHNVLYGGCSALPWAAKKGNLGLVRKILEIPYMEEFASTAIWNQALKIAQIKDNVGLAEMLFGVKAVQTLIQNAAAVLAGRRVYLPYEFPPLDDDNHLLLKPMFEAAWKGQQNFIKLYLPYVSVDLHDSQSWTLLHYAVASGHNSLIKLLKEEHNANPDLHHHAYYRPIDLAAQHDHSRTVELLLSYGVDPCYKGTSISIAFLLAVSEGRENVVKLFLKDDRIDPNARNDEIRIGGLIGTPLELAISKGRVGVVRFLLDDVRLNPNGRDNRGRPPLVLAATNCLCKSRGEAILDMLLKDKRVDFTARDLDGNNACLAAVKKAYYDRTRMILEAGKIDPNEGDKFGETPAMYAAQHNNRILKLLIEDKRVDLNKKSNSGDTALLRATRMNMTEHVALLLKSRRVNVDQPDNGGNTPMIWACRNWDPVTAALLLKTGSVNLEKKSNIGCTPLMIAIGYSAPGEPYAERIAEMILDTGHDLLDVRYDNGFTLLECAVAQCSEKIVVKLLKTGKVIVTPEAMELCRIDAFKCLLWEYQKRYWRTRRYICL
ncbi:hypothetical protein TrVFT333_001816 [Trichoderma virens FT-333]|nr:hypothetical protein TrVFT333_001816 [Trichoderma virens FT-333]